VREDINLILREGGDLRGREDLGEASGISGEAILR